MRDNPLELVARIAERYVGVKGEGPRGNHGAEIRRFQESTWLEGTGWPWCAAFVSYVFQVAARDEGFALVSIDALPRTPRAYDFDTVWAQRNSALVFSPRQKKIRPRRGDIVVFNFSHVGIIARAPGTGGIVETVEGNTSPGNTGSQRDGAGVYRRRRNVSLVRNFVRPALKATEFGQQRARDHVGRKAR